MLNPEYKWKLREYALSSIFSSIDFLPETMAALFSENLGLDIASVNSDGGNLDASSTSCMSSLGNGFSAVKVQETIPPSWSTYLTMTEYLSEDLDPQLNIRYEARRQRLSRESSSTETDSAKWTTWDSPSLVSKEKRLYKVSNRHS